MSTESMVTQAALADDLRYIATILEANASKFAVPDHIPQKARKCREAADLLARTAAQPEREAVLEEARRVLVQNKRINDAIQTALERGELYISDTGYLAALTTPTPAEAAPRTAQPDPLAIAMQHIEGIGEEPFVVMKTEDGWKTRTLAAHEVLTRAAQPEREAVLEEAELNRLAGRLCEIMHCEAGQITRMWAKQAVLEIATLTTPAPAVPVEEIVAALEPFAFNIDYVDFLQAADDDLIERPPLKAGDYRRAAAILSRLRGEGE